MQLILYIIIFVMASVSVSGNFIERNVVNRRISKELGRNKKLAFSNKMRNENLKIYGEICDKYSESKWWYYTLKFIYNNYKYLMCLGALMTVFTILL